MYTYSKDKRQELINEVRDLFIRMQQGDNTAFPLLYEKMCPDVISTIKRTGVRDSDIEDVMQEVFIDVINKCSSCTETQAALKWINRIAFNKSVDFLRKNQREALVAEDDMEIFEESKLVAPIEVPEDVAESKEVQRLINDIICQLPPLQLAVVRAYYFQEMKVHEIATEMQIPDGTVKTYLYKSRTFIEKEVRLLAQKHKTKLYSAPVLPLLYWLFVSDIESCKASPAMLARVYESVTKAVGQMNLASGAGTATMATGNASTAVATGATTASAVVAKKVALIVTALALVTGGTTFAVIHASQEKASTAVESSPADASIPVTVKDSEAKLDNDAVREELKKYYKSDIVPQYGVGDNEIKTLITRGEEIGLDKFEKRESKDGIVNTILMDIDNDGFDELLVVTLKVTIEEKKAPTEKKFYEKTNDELLHGNTEFTILVYKYDSSTKSIIEITNGVIKGPRIGQPVWSDAIVQCACKKVEDDFYIYFTSAFTVDRYDGADDVAWGKVYVIRSGDLTECVVGDPRIITKQYDELTDLSLENRLSLSDCETNMPSIVNGWNYVLQQMAVESDQHLMTIRQSAYASTCPVLNPFSVVDPSYTDIFTYKPKQDSLLVGYNNNVDWEPGNQEEIIFEVDAYNTTKID